MRICILGQSSEIGFKKNEAGKKGNCLDRINGRELLLPPVIDNHCIEELYVNTAVEPPRPSFQSLKGISKGCAALYGK